MVVKIDPSPDCIIVQLMLRLERAGILWWNIFRNLFTDALGITY
jgi:hypothetical protein